jgi:hypothetical protein
MSPRNTNQYGPESMPFTHDLIHDSNGSYT